MESIRQSLCVRYLFIAAYVLVLVFFGLSRFGLTFISNWKEFEVPKRTPVVPSLSKTQ